MNEVILPSTAVSLDAWEHFLAVSSTRIQLFEVNFDKWRSMVVADHEVLEVCTYTARRDHSYITLLEATEAIVGEDYSVFIQHCMSESEHTTMCRCIIHMNYYK